MSLEGLSDEQIRALAELSHGMSTDPRTRRDFQRLIKTRAPATVIPELDTEEAIAKATGALQERNEALSAELANDRLARKREKLQQALAEQYPNLTFSDIEKTMTDHAIGSHESAARFLANERRLAEPAAEIPGRGGPMMMPAEAKQFFKSPTQTARRLAHEVMTDLVNKRARQRAA